VLSVVEFVSIRRPLCGPPENGILVLRQPSAKSRIGRRHPGLILQPPTKTPFAWPTSATAFGRPKEVRG